jgi:hypothetical protein
LKGHQGTLEGTPARGAPLSVRIRVLHLNLAPLLVPPLQCFLFSTHYSDLSYITKPMIQSGHPIRARSSLRPISVASTIPGIIYRRQRPTIIHRRQRPTIIYRRQRPTIIYRRQRPKFIYRRQRPTSVSTPAASLPARIASSPPAVAPAPAEPRRAPRWRPSYRPRCGPKWAETTRPGPGSHVPAAAVPGPLDRALPSRHRRRHQDRRRSIWGWGRLGGSRDVVVTCPWL